MSRLSKPVMLGVVLLGVAASSVQAGEIYVVREVSNFNTIGYYDGNNFIEIVTETDVETAHPVDLLDANAMTDLTIDTVQQKFMWRQFHHSSQMAVVRCNLDGTNIEILPGLLGGASIIYRTPVAYNPPAGTVPAVSTWGFGIMLLLMLGIATLAFQRRATTTAGCEVDGVVGR